jgi:N-acetylneuraminic acid mutarotase
LADSIYVFGGAQDEGFPVATVFSSPDSGATWHDAGTLAQPVRYPAIAVIETAAYLFGGVTTTDGTDTTAIQRYDPKTHTTRVVAQLPAPLSHASAITFGNVVFLLGGYVNNTPSTQVLRFDASTNSITNVGALPAPLTDGAATVIAGTGYLIGGEEPGRATTANVETLKPR